MVVVLAVAATAAEQQEATVATLDMATVGQAVVVVVVAPPAGSLLLAGLVEARDIMVVQVLALTGRLKPAAVAGLVEPVKIHTRLHRQLEEVHFTRLFLVFQLPTAAAVLALASITSEDLLLAGQTQAMAASGLMVDQA